MQITSKSLERFKTLYLKYFNEELSEEKLKRKVEYLLEVYRVVYDTENVTSSLPSGEEQEQVVNN
jgi:hypothetical protein